MLYYNLWTGCAVSVNPFRFFFIAHKYVFLCYVLLYLEEIVCIVSACTTIYVFT
jgi:hypothetical protein